MIKLFSLIFLCLSANADYYTDMYLYIYNQLASASTSWPPIDPLTQQPITEHYDLLYTIHTMNNYGKPINCYIIQSNTILLIHGPRIPPAEAAIRTNIDILMRFCN